MIKTSAPPASDTPPFEQPDWSPVQESGVAETIDPCQLQQNKAKLIKTACEISAAARRYQKIHRALFGFSARKVLQAMKSEKRVTELAALEAELDSIDTEAKRIRCTIVDADANDLPKRAKTFIAVHDALLEYIEALIAAAGGLSHICSNLRRERDGEAAFTHYSADKLRQDKAGYDDSVQEFRRWGTRLTELFEKF